VNVNASHNRIDCQVTQTPETVVEESCYHKSQVHYTAVQPNERHHKQTTVGFIVPLDNMLLVILETIFQANLSTGSNHPAFLTNRFADSDDN